MVGTAYVYNAFTSSMLQCFCRSCQVNIAEKKVCHGQPPTANAKVVQRPPKKVAFLATEIRCTEQAKGGIKYELVLSEPALEAPKLASPPKNSLSVEEIQNKLKAAEERRASLEAQKISSVVEKMSHLNEVKEKREEFNNNFMQTTRDSLERKMESNKENREAYLKSIKEKARDHVMKIDEVRKTGESPQKKEILMEEFNKKMAAASAAREANISALRERLKEHEMHITNVRKSMEESVESKRESWSKKLSVAAEKREMIIQEIRDKMKDHDKHIAEALRQKEEYAETLREKQARKLEIAEEKRNAYIKEIQEKNKEHKSHVLQVRQLNMLNQQEVVENKLQQITKKLDEAESKRLVQLQSLQEKLQEHERHVEEVRRKAMSANCVENSSG